MKEALKDVLKHTVRTQTGAHSLDAIGASIDDVRANFKYVGHDEIEQVKQGIFAAETDDAESQVLYHTHGSLSVNGVSVHQAVFEQGDDSIDVIFAHLSYVLKHERKRLEHTILDVHVRGSVLVHKSGQNGEGTAGLSYDGDSDSGAHAVLALLDLEIVE
jgi:hypothetical protein